MFRLLVVVVISFFMLTFDVLANAKYDRKSNTVTISSIMDMKRATLNLGWIKIYNEKHIVIKATGFNEAEELIGLCKNNPNLGLIVLNRIEQEIAPKVSDTLDFVNDLEKYNEDGFTWGYILKEDDALDFMDRLYEYNKLTLMISTKCPKSKDGKMISGPFILNFSTRGLERAMKRIKDN